MVSTKACGASMDAGGGNSHQATQQIEDVLLRRCTRLQRHFDPCRNDLLIVMQQQGENFDHFPVTTRPLQEL